MADAHKNFAYSTVFAAPSPATTGTSLTVQSGEGARFPTPPFNATVWPINSQPLSTTAEIVRVTGIAGDVLTIARSQESSTTRTIGNGDQIAAAITVKTLTDIEQSAATIDGWIAAGETWVYASATTFIISGDVTSKYQVGDRVKLTQTSVKYFLVVGVTFVSPNTEIKVTAGTDFTLANTTITNPAFSKQANPQGFPSAFTFTPTVAGTGSMTYGTLTITQARASAVGRTATVWLYVSGTTGGTASSGLVVSSLPIPRISGIAFAEAGFGQTVDGTSTATSTGHSVWNGTSATSIIVNKNDESNWGIGAGREIRFIFTYEI